MTGQEEDSEPILEIENPVAIGNSDNIVDGASSSSSDTDDVTKPLDTATSVVNGFQFPFHFPSYLLH